MKSFSFKALALTLIVVAAPAQADWKETLQGYASSVTENAAKVVNTVKDYTDKALVGVLRTVYAADIQIFGRDATPKFPEEVAGLPVFNKLRNSSKYVHAAVVAAVVAAPVAAYKLYKHFTKPAVEAEGENTEANDETVA